MGRLREGAAANQEKRDGGARACLYPPISLPQPVHSRLRALAAREVETMLWSVERDRGVVRGKKRPAAEKAKVRSERKNNAAPSHGALLFPDARIHTHAFCAPPPESPGHCKVCSASIAAVGPR